MKSSKLYQIVTKISIRFGTRYSVYVLRATSISHAKKVVKTCPYYGTIKENGNFYPTNERIHEVFELDPKNLTEENLNDLKNIGNVFLSDVEDDEFLKYPRS